MDTQNAAKGEHQSALGSFFTKQGKTTFPYTIFSLLGEIQYGYFQVDLLAVPGQHLHGFLLGITGTGTDAACFVGQEPLVPVPGYMQVRLFGGDPGAID